MPAYPFISIFLAQYLLYITEYRTKATRLFAAILTSIVSVVLIGCALVLGGVIDPVAIVGQFTDRVSTIETVQYVAGALTVHNGGTMFILSILLILLCCVYVQMFKKINIKILYATIALTFGINLLIDGVVMRSIRNGSTSRTFAEKIQKEYPVDGKNMYVMNDLTQYVNLYGLNFYLGNQFHNFEKMQPAEGFFFATKKNFPKIEERYKDRYTFDLLETTPNVISDVRDYMQMYKFSRK